jgi:glycosyltransferase involved in cell wall biosynthesis
MSEGMVDLYRKGYPGLKCSALVHSFNEPIREFGSMPALHSPLRLTISGNINESCRDAAVRFSDAVMRLDNVCLNLLSGTSPAYLQDLGLLRNGVRHETVARDRLMKRLEETDIVVLLHGFSGRISEEELSTMFPTKTIEYLICGRPILAHTPPDCFLTDFLKRHQCALIVDTPSVAALMEAVERLRTDFELRASLVRHALQAGKMFHAPHVAQTLRSALSRNPHASDV